MKKLALFDFDNVFYKGHSVFDVIRAQEKDGFIGKEVWIAVEEQLGKYKRGEVSYKAAADQMLKAWAMGLKEKSYEDVLNYVNNYFDNNKEKFATWFQEEIPEIKKEHDVFIVSTNFQFITEAVVSRFGLDGYLSSEAEVFDGKFTGMVSKSLAGNKGEVVSLLNKYSTNGSVAVGDSENDIEMLELVSKPICYKPDEALLAIAKKRNWTVVDEISISGELRGS